MVKAVFFSTQLLINVVLLNAQTHFNPYIPQVPVNDYRQAETQRQKMYDYHVQILQSQLDNLSKLKQELLYNLDRNAYNQISNEISDFYDKYIKQPVDWSDDYYFKPVSDALDRFEKEIY